MENKLTNFLYEDTKAITAVIVKERHLLLGKIKGILFLEKISIVVDSF